MPEYFMARHPGQSFFKYKTVARRIGPKFRDALYQIMSDKILRVA